MANTPAKSAIGLLLGVLLGCGGGGKLPDRAPVEGQVTLDGVPLRTGKVIFLPDNARGTSGPMAVGEIDAEGRYQLRTQVAEEATDGAMLGFHRVRIEAYESAEPGAPARWLVPRRYNDPQQSGLTAEVKAQATNQIDFSLSSSVVVQP